MPYDPILGYQDQGEGDIREALAEAQKRARIRSQREYDRALDYVEGRQRQDLEEELIQRFPNAQQGEWGQRIYPVVVPLTDKYIAEAADTYNHQTERRLVDENGEESEATKRLTADYNKALDECAFDEKLHLGERITAGLSSAGILIQAKRGMLCPTIIAPQNIFEVMEDPEGKDVCDPDDYEGFILEQRGVPGINQNQRTFTLTAREGFYSYKGSEPYRPSTPFAFTPNPYKWRMPTDNGVMSMMPLSMLTFMQRQLSTDGVLPMGDPDIINGNREINVLMSVLFDEIRFQGASVPIKKVTDPSNTKAYQRAGVRFPVVLGLEEEFNFVSANTNYTEQLEVIKTFVKMLAMSKRMSPNDFSLEGEAVTSGFSKVVDSMPKMEARQERQRRLKYLEERCLFPRVSAALILLGVLPAEVSKLRLRVRFGDSELPMSEQERALRIQTDMDLDLTTAAHEYAEEYGVSVEEAQKAIEENKAANAEGKATKAAQSQPPSMFGNQPSLGLGSRIGQKSKAP